MAEKLARRQTGVMRRPVLGRDEHRGTGILTPDSNLTPAFPARASGCGSSSSVTVALPSPIFTGFPDVQRCLSGGHAARRYQRTRSCYAADGAVPRGKFRIAQGLSISRQLEREFSIRPPRASSAALEMAVPAEYNSAKWPSWWASRRSGSAGRLESREMFGQPRSDTCRNDTDELGGNARVSRRFRCRVGHLGRPATPPNDLPFGGLYPVGATPTGAAETAARFVSTASFR